jgi:hypothetical protein
MSAAAKNCTQCGSPLEGAKEVAGVEQPAPPPRHRRRIWPWIVGAVVVAAIAIWFVFARKHDAKVAVVGHRWARAIAIEEYGDHERSAWRDEIPAGASLPTCTRRRRSTRQIPDGEDCHTERHDKKDGTFEQVKKCTPKTRSEGVDDDWCTFTVRSWLEVDRATASGAGMSPAWPDSKLPAAPAEIPALGTRREGARTETLALDFGAAGTCEVSDATWRRYADGARIDVEVRARSDEVVCSSIP